VPEGCMRQLDPASVLWTQAGKTPADIILAHRVIRPQRPTFLVLGQNPRMYRLKLLFQIGRATVTVRLVVVNPISPFDKSSAESCISSHDRRPSGRNYLDEYLSEPLEPHMRFCLDRRPI
jgi:hypothetical protein